MSSDSAAEAPLSMLARVFAILDTFKTGEPQMSLAELTVRTRIPKPSLYRITRDLVEAGILERCPGGFCLGIKVFELGELVNSPRQLRDAALPYLEELYEITHEVVNLGVLSGTDVLYYAKIAGHKGMVLPTRVGGRWPAHATALGKVMLAFAPQHNLRRVLASGLEQMTPYTITDPRRLLRQLEDVRREGVAYDLEESKLGVVCVAAPVFVDGRLSAALSVSGPSLRQGPKRWESALRRVSASISRTMSENRVVFS
jgi:IclR family transcriptional regulator, acetate operon repressor